MLMPQSVVVLVVVQEEAILLQLAVLETLMKDLRAEIVLVLVLTHPVVEVAVAEHLLLVVMQDQGKQLQVVLDNPTQLLEVL
jgi:NADH:ubiquinone oxidoreductase subunit K